VTDGSFHDVVLVATSDDLTAALAAGAQYVARVIEGSTRARRLDASARAIVAGGATDALEQVLGPDSTAPTADASEVDSAFRARRVLAGHPGERLLVIVEASRPVRVFALATAGGDDTALRWITDMPDDESLMAARVLLSSSRPLLRTRLTSDGSATGEVSVVEREALRDRKISFSFVGHNVGFVPAAGDGPPLAAVDSDYLDPLGDDCAFAVRVVPHEPGTASVDVEVTLDDGTVLPQRQRIDLTTIASDDTPAATVVARVETPFTVPPEASVWIRWAGDELAYEVDGVGDTHPIAANRGELEGAELRSLVAELDAIAEDDADDSAAATVRLARVGARLHALVYGLDARDVTDETAAAARRIAALGVDIQGVDGQGVPRVRIDDDELRLPWEVFYDAGYDDSSVPRLPDTIDQVVPAGFWGYRFRLDHTVRRGAADARRPGDHVLSVGAPSVVPFVAELISGDAVTDDALVAANDALLASLATAGAVVRERSTDLLGWVASASPAEIVYVYGHGTSARSTDQLGRQSQQAATTQATLDLGTARLTVDDLRAAEPDPPDLAGSPLVVLNACSTLHGDAAYDNPFVDLLCGRWRARAVVGAVAPLPAAFAVEWAQRLLDELLAGGVQLGDALHRATRASYDAGAPFGLLYALHGRSELQVRNDR
jgi:hypothetical protein